MATCNTEIGQVLTQNERFPRPWSYRQLQRRSCVQEAWLSEFQKINTGGHVILHLLCLAASYQWYSFCSKKIYDLKTLPWKLSFPNNKSSHYTMAAAFRCPIINGASKYRMKSYCKFKYIQLSTTTQTVILFVLVFAVEKPLGRRSDKVFLR